MARLALGIGSLQLPSECVAVAKNLQVDFILGADVVQSQGAIVDLDSSLIHFGHGACSVELQKSTKTPIVARVVLQQDVVIPGRKASGERRLCYSTEMEWLWNSTPRA